MTDALSLDAIAIVKATAPRHLAARERPGDTADWPLAAMVIGKEQVMREDAA